jgi:hypothetical protein
MTVTTDIVAMYKCCLLNTTKYSFSILCNVEYKFETCINCRFFACIIVASSGSIVSLVYLALGEVIDRNLARVCETARKN